MEIFKFAIGTEVEIEANSYEEACEKIEKMDFPDLEIISLD